MWTTEATKKHARMFAENKSIPELREYPYFSAAGEATIDYNDLVFFFVFRVKERDIQEHDTRGTDDLRLQNWEKVCTQISLFLWRIQVLQPASTGCNDDEQH